MRPNFTVIPAIDLLHGQVVRLTQGDYAQVSHYDIDPASLAKKYEDAGASRIHIVDLDGAKAGKLVNLNAITAIRKAVSCELEVGGGLRNEESIDILFSIGVNYAILGSVLIKDPNFAIKQIHRFPKKILAGLDCHGDKIAIHGWVESSQATLLETISNLEGLPLGGIIYTDIATDGTLAGPNLPMLELLRKMTDLPIIASGGIGTSAHLSAVADLGVFGCIVGKAILSGTVSLDTIFWRKNT